MEKELLNSILSLLRSVAHPSAFAFFISVVSETPYFLASFRWLIVPPMYSARIAFQSGRVSFRAIVNHSL